jgi:hypothetical protein
LCARAFAQRHAALASRAGGAAPALTRALCLLPAALSWHRTRLLRLVWRCPWAATWDPSPLWRCPWAATWDPSPLWSTAAVHTQPRPLCLPSCPPFQSYYGGLLCAAWSPDGAYVATGGEDDLVCLYGLAERAVVAVGEGHTSWVAAVAFDEGCASASCCVAWQGGAPPCPGIAGAPRPASSLPVLPVQAAPAWAAWRLPLGGRASGGSPTASACSALIHPPWHPSTHCTRPPTDTATRLQGVSGGGGSRPAVPHAPAGGGWRGKRYTSNGSSVPPGFCRPGLPAPTLGLHGGRSAAAGAGGGHCAGKQPQTAAQQVCMGSSRRPQRSRCAREAAADRSAAGVHGKQLQTAAQQVCTGSSRRPQRSRCAWEAAADRSAAGVHGKQLQTAAQQLCMGSGGGNGGPCPWQIRLGLMPCVHS